MVSITLRVLSRPDVEHLSRIYQSLGMDYDERVLPSIGNEVLKSIVAQFDAAELITQREVVRSLAWHISREHILIVWPRCHQGSDQTYSSGRANSISSLRMSQSHI